MSTCIKSVRTDTHLFELHDNNIVWLRIVNGSDIEMEQALESHEVMKQLIGDRTCVLMIDLRGTQFNTSPEARNFASTKEGSSTRVADAILLDSLAHSLVGNFYIRFNKPPIPTRICKSEEKALEWATGQLDKYREKMGRLKTT